MSLEEYKITDGDVSTHGVVSAPDKLRDTTQNNKRRFDQLIRDAVKGKFNGLVDALTAALAEKMPAPGDYGAPGEYLMTDGEGGVTWGTAPGGGDMLASKYAEEGGDGVVLHALEADHAGTAGTAEACSGNATTASKLANARTLTVKDNDQTNAGPSVSFDGSGNIILRLPAAIKAALTGNADTATKLKTARTLTVKDNDQTNAGPSVSFDGSGNIILRLPAAIKAALTGNADTATKLKTARNIGSASFDGSAGITLAQIGAAALGHVHALADMTGTLSAAKGGTGQTSLSAALNALINSKTVVTGVPDDDTLYLSGNTDGSGDYWPRKTVKLYEYIKGKLDSVYAPLLHNHSAGAITSGTIDTARIPDLDAGKVTSGTFAAARIPGLAASKITSGTFGAERIPELAASKITGASTTLNALTARRIYIGSSAPSSPSTGDIWIKI